MAASVELARAALAKCAGQRIDHAPASVRAWFFLVYSLMVAMVLASAWDAPWPARIFIGLACLPMGWICRWQWRLLWGGALHVEADGLRVFESATEHRIAWAALDVSTPFPNMIALRFTDEKGRARSALRYVRPDAPVQWAVLRGERSVKP